jgi:uncharacterized protein (TIGR03083 family)
MTGHSPPDATILPAAMVLRTAGGCDLDPGHLLEAFGRQRRRFVTVLEGFGPDDWAAPTRCADWSAQDVVRHLCDYTAVGGSAGPGDRTFDLTAGHDPRITPGQRLATTAGEPPDATLRRLVSTTSQALATLGDRLAQGRRFDVHLPYGPMDWTILVLHGLWDAWIHERDILLPLGASHPTDPGATSYAAAYGVFAAAAVAARFGDSVRCQLTLGGPGGGVFDLDNDGGLITLTATPMSAAGPPVAQVTDALAGRATASAVLAHLPPATRASLSLLADFYNTPVAQNQPAASAEAEHAS